MEGSGSGRSPIDRVVPAIRARHRELTGLLGKTSTDDLLAPSRLPGWSRLTIVCHLRYGARASAWMIEQTLAGEPTAFYPQGRDRMRPATLALEPGEDVADAVTSLTRSNEALESLLAELDDSAWERRICEPGANPDLGPISLGRLAFLRLTEIEVHGTDLDLGARPWSDAFVDLALPMRLRWLQQRRSNRSTTNPLAAGCWRFTTDTVDLVVQVDQAGAVTVDDASSITPQPDCTVEGSTADVLAAVLGRTPIEDLVALGDRSAAATFLAVFPPP